MTVVPGWAGPYIGVPFVDGGRDLKGMDCEGLCRVVMRDKAGNPPIPEYGMLSAHGLSNVVRAISHGSALPPWVKVDTPRPFDWVVMTAMTKVDGRLRIIPCHLGVMLTDDVVLHVEELTCSVAVSLRHPLIAPRINGFVRHEALA